MADIAQLVAGVRKAVAATRSMDATLRVKAEAQFKQMSLTNYARLVYALGEIMRDAAIPLDDADRQQASVLIQGIIKPRDPAMRGTYAKLWTDQSDSFKVQVKKQLVEAMGQPGAAGAALSRSAAACLAEVAVLEIPHKRWPTFAQEMQQLVRTEERNAACQALRKNAVTLIGQVCGQLEPRFFSQPEVDMLLASLRAGMTSAAPAVIAAALDALTSSMKFVEANLGVKAQRDSLMGDLVNKGVKSGVPIVQEKALQCIVALCDDYYRFMAEYINGVMQMTVNLLKSPATADEVKIQAIEVWNTLLEVELDIVEGNQNFMRRYGLTLVPILMQGMIFRSQDVANSEENVPERSARTTLQLLAQLLRSVDMLKAVMAIVVKCIALPPEKWAHREMGFMAMGLVMDVAEDTATAAQVKPFIRQLVGAIVQSTNNAAENPITKDSALWALDRIFVFVLDQFPEPVFALKTLQHVLGLVERSRTPTMVLRATNCVRSYHKFFRHCPAAARPALVQHLCPPKVHETVLMTMAKATSTRRAMLGEQNLGTVIFDCLQHIINVPGITYNPQTAEAMKPYFVTIHTVYNQFVQQLKVVLQNQALSAETRDILVAGCCSSLSACLLSFEKTGGKYTAAISTASKKATEELLQCCFAVQKLQNAGSVQEEALMVTNRIVSILGDKATPYVPQIMQNMKAVIDAKASEYEVKLALGLLIEVYMFGWQAPAATHDQIMSLLMRLAQDPHLSRNIKPQILEAMTCVLTNLKGAYVKYLPAVLAWLTIAMQAKKPLGDDLTEEQADAAACVDNLRSEILLFVSELLHVAAAAPQLANPAFQRALGGFLMTLARPGEAAPDDKEVVRILVTDLRQPATQQLFDTLAAQPAFKAFVSS